MDRASLEEGVKKLDWMHTIDLGHGVTTPGQWPCNPDIMKAFESINFNGKKVLDIGTCNGLWSFEAEKRGAAEVYSIDYLTHVSYWCTPAYKFAHEALQSKAIYNPDINVYDIENLGIHDFDIVIFCGIYYHLKHPLLALSMVRRVLKTGGHVIIEGPVISNEERALATFHYKSLLTNDRSNWWVPTLRCLREWVECSFFDILAEFEQPDPPSMNGMGAKAKNLIKTILGRRNEYTTKRTVLLAQGVERDDPFYRSPDEDLISFMLAKATGPR